MYVPPPICGEGYPLSAEQRELLATASRLGREKFASRAAQYDRDATFPFENYDDMRAAGLLTICVPKRYGGIGADFVTYSMVAAEIGRHDGSTALTWNMHVCSTLWSGALADDLDMTPAERARARAEPRGPLRADREARQALRAAVLGRLGARRRARRRSARSPRRSTAAGC